MRHCSCFEEKYLKIFKINQMPASSIKPLYPALPFSRPEDGGGGEGGQKSSVNIGQEEGGKNYKRDGPLHLASKSKIDLMIFRKAALPFVWARSGRQLFETLPDLSQFQKIRKRIRGIKKEMAIFCCISFVIAPLSRSQNDAAVAPLLLPGRSLRSSRHYRHDIGSPLVRPAMLLDRREEGKNAIAN